MVGGRRCLSWLVLLLFGWGMCRESSSQSLNTLAPPWKFPIARTNKVIQEASRCNATDLHVSLQLEMPFKGLLAAKDFAHECSVVGSHGPEITIDLPTSGCGVRLNAEDDKLYYTVTFVIQHDRHLRQISDQEHSVKCLLPDDAMVLRSQPMVEAVRAERKLRMDARTGRKQSGWSEAGGWSKAPPEDEEPATLAAARAWLEIRSAEDGSGMIQVGEPTLLSVRTTLPVGIGWKVIECLAHDGTGEGSQRLLDSRGCPLDALLVPEPAAGPGRLARAGLLRHQEVSATFPAFKFPDRDRLHVSCGLQLCRGRCQKVNCSVPHEEVQRATKGQEGEVLDRLEVFNSIEVLAPGIELDAPEGVNVISSNQGGKKVLLASSLPGDRTFCVSPNKMALAFCVLGLIFVGAVLVALCSLMKARRPSSKIPYYTRSLFSSSTSTASGYGGSKLLLNDSPNSQRAARPWRIL